MVTIGIMDSNYLSDGFTQKDYVILSTVGVESEDQGCLFIDL
jgi:hypothetical protein